MPIPLLAVALFKIAVAAITAYEAYQILDEVFESIDDYTGDLEKAKEELEEYFRQVKQEIEDNIEGREEVAVLQGLTTADTRPVTVQGRGSRSSAEVKAAILQKIPYRQIISKICEAADKMPVLQVRKRRGLSVKDVVTAKSALIKKLLGEGFEALSGEDLTNFLIVKQKQLAASLVFEFLDYGLEWQSPLKTEVAFGPPRSFANPPVEGTKLTRVGSDLNPFYPAPHRRRGSISADLIIPDYRKEPVEKTNLFAIVEIKFPGDRIKTDQIDTYNLLLDRAAFEKTGVTAGTLNSSSVNSGGRLALFRFPEDAVGISDDEQRPSSSIRRNR